MFIKGNHDIWCEEWLAGKEAEDLWLNNGGLATIQSYAKFSQEEKAKHLKFFKEMPLCHIDDNNRLFVHAGFTAEKGVENEFDPSNFYWDRTLWETALLADAVLDKESIFYPSRLAHYKEIYIGHTPTTNYQRDTPMKAINVFNIDTGAAFTGRLSAMNIDNKVFFQTDPVYQLYPDEKGRNGKPYKPMK